MGGYEDYLIKKYTQRGLTQGIEKGLAQGMVLAIKSLMENMQWTLEQAMDALNIPEDVREEYTKKIIQS